MSARFDALFHELREQAPPAPFAPAVAVRRRGRRRARRQALLAGVAVFATIGVGVGGAMVVLGPPPPEAPTAAGAAPVTPAEPDHHPDDTGAAGSTTLTPAGPGPNPDVADAGSPALIPAGWLLTPADLRPGRWRSGWEPERFAGVPPWLWADLCPADVTVELRSLAARRDLRTVTWTDGPPPETGAAPAGAWVDQVVELFAPGMGPANLADIRAVLAACRMQPTAASGGPVAYVVNTTEFAGDESILVEEWVGDVVSLVAVVRVGDVVTSLRSFDPEYGRTNWRELLRLAEQAAARLRSDG